MAPIRVTLLTGFLGAGKTTLLNALLRDPALVDTAVIVNEFGEIGIDHLLVESSGEEIIELADGCVCCTVRGALVDTLADLVDRVQTGRLRPLARVVIETTGLADPAPILASLMSHPVLLQHFALDGIVTVVDAWSGLAAIEGRIEAERQIACADRIVLTKTDLAGDVAPDFREYLNDLNPRAARLDAAAGEAGAEAILGLGLYDPATRRHDLRRWLEGTGADAHGSLDGHEHGHEHEGHRHLHRHQRVRSFSLIERAPIATAGLQDFLGLLGETEGERILRMKAMVLTREDPQRPLVLHGVRGRLHPPASLPAWPAGMVPLSRLVLIGEDLDEIRVRDLFAAFTGAPRLGAPDRTALMDNPLAIAGLGSSALRRAR